MTPDRGRRAAIHRTIAGAALAALLVPAAAAADSITLTWTATGDDGAVGTASTYDLRYADHPVAGTDTTTWWNAAQSVGTLPPPSAAGTRESYTMSGLATGTVLYFMIRAADEVPNWSGYSDVSMRTAGDGSTALATPASFAARASGGDVSLAWLEPASGVGSGYRLRRRAGSAGADTLLATLPPGATSFVDSTVLVGTAYEYRISTYLGAEEGTAAVAGVTVPDPALASARTTVHGFPNPTRSSVTFRYNGGSDDGSPTRVRLVVYDLTGHRICRLLDDVIAAGDHTIQWACRSDDGTPVAPGLYNVILDGPRGRSVTRLAVLP
ncbi:MAG: hypothetical protein ACM3JJ_08440 [Hyphomicrobiales bacterium]